MCLLSHSTHSLRKRQNHQQKVLYPAMTSANSCIPTGKSCT